MLAANAEGPGGDNTAWDCNDSGGLSDQRLNVDLFPVRIEPDERVTVTINFMESDGDADTEARAAAATAAALTAVTIAIPPAAAVTVPVGWALGVATSVFQAFK